MTESNSERIDAELIAIESIVGDTCLERTGPRSLVIFLGDANTLTITLPEGYPTIEPPIASISLRPLQPELVAYIEKSWRGEELVLDVYEWANESLCAHAQKIKNQTTAFPQNSAGLQPLGHICVIMLDHMRNRRRYDRYLEQFALNSEVTCHAIITTSKRQNSSVDASQVVLVVCGIQEGVAAFLKQLRTERVDVDAKGKSCRERQLKILHTSTTSKVDHTLPSAGLIVKLFETDRDVDPYWCALQTSFCSDSFPSFANLIRCHMT